MKYVLAFHKWLYEFTDGRLGHGMLGVPTLLLTTTGRRSGQPRTQALVYCEHGDDLAVVASWGGSDKHPAWFLNLSANNEVTVQRKRSSSRYTATEAVGAERDAWWERANSANKGRFDEYQSGTDRKIPVVVLTPV